MNGLAKIASVVMTAAWVLFGQVNINEALDIWYRHIDIPPMEPGDHIAIINAGAYSSAMSSNHCMRGAFSEILLD